MGKRGPKKRSREEVAASLSRVHAPLNSFESETIIPADPYDPVKPNWLSPEAAQFWDETLPQLKEMGIHKVDTALFSMLCQNVGTYVWCQRVVREQGAILKHPNGHEFPRPELKMAADAEKRAKSLSEHFGLSLRARQAMNIKLMRRPSEVSRPAHDRFGFD